MICHAECFQSTPQGQEIIDLLTTSNGDSSDMIERYLDFRATDGSFPLHHIVKQGNSTLLNFLINKGANVNSKDMNGITPADILDNIIKIL